MSELHFWGECKKTLERDLPVEEYTTWIAPLTLEQNNGSNPLSYSVLAPNKFISDWVEDNYGPTIKERLSAITSNVDLSLNFEIFMDYHENNNQQVLDEIDESKQDLKKESVTSKEKPKKSNLIEDFTFPFLLRNILPLNFFKFEFLPSEIDSPNIKAVPEG